VRASVKGPVDLIGIVLYRTGSFFLMYRTFYLNIYSNFEEKACILYIFCIIRFSKKTFPVRNCLHITN
jgi:hypothetical protein